MTPRKKHTSSNGQPQRAAGGQPRAARHARGAGGTPQAGPSVRPTVRTVQQVSPTLRAEAPSSLDKGVFTIPNSQLVVSRRHLLYGAIGVGVIAAGTTAAGALGLLGHDDTADLTILSVPTSAVTTSEELSEVELSAHFGLVGDFEMPYGTLVWCNDPDVAACLVPGEAAKPLTQVQLLYLGNGGTKTIVGQAVGQDEGFEIYDVRATSDGVVWTEADILEGVWRVYTARLDSDGDPVEYVRVDSGNADWETPTLALVGNKAFWQVMPRSNGNAAASDSVLKKAVVGTTNVDVVYSSPGRMATPPNPTLHGVVITPRTPTSAVHYQLTYVDAASGSVVDTMVLPQAMKPLEAGYGKTGFTFCFDGIYDYGDGIANLGTYVPLQRATGADYNYVPWFRFSRTPACAPCWCGDYLVVKSTQAVCGIDFSSSTYFATDVLTGSADYGDFLATTGEQDIMVTFANITRSLINQAEEQLCAVRVYAPL
ncbi:MAG: Tat pathway signal protein [Coriobacteriia bacterium]|nr:Tat pathway signal protein [Coriobacteriia bacterium]